MLLGIAVFLYGNIYLRGICLPFLHSIEISVPREAKGAVSSYRKIADRVTGKGCHPDRGSPTEGGLPDI